MADFKFTIPIIGKIIAYIHDFCTYKKKYNVFIDFLARYENDGYLYFKIQIHNLTSQHIRINKIYANDGSLEFLYEDRSHFNHYKYILYKKDDFIKNTIKKNIVLNGLSETHHNQLQSRFKGSKGKVIVEYENLTERSWILSNNRKVKRDIPV